jgi:hypothetical protein
MTLEKQVEEYISSCEPFGWKLASANHRAAFVQRVMRSNWHVMGVIEIALRWDWYSRGWHDAETQCRP